jgi:hypothetical protein
MHPPEVKLVRSDADFESIGWHDNFVRAIHFLDVSGGRGDLALDIDHILEWVKAGDSFQFWVSPASLVFHDVSDLSIYVDWSDSMLELVIDEIRREPSDLEGFSRFTIQIDWPLPGGRIQFLSKGFTQTLRRRPILTSSSKLDASQRCGLDDTSD